MTAALLLAAALGATRLSSAAPVPSPKGRGPAPAAAGPRLSVESRAVRPGEVLLVVVEGADPVAPPSASLRGKDLSFFPGASTGTWLALAALDLDASTGPARLEAVLRDPAGRAARTQKTLFVRAARFPIEALSVPEGYVTLPKSDLERAESEAAALHRLFARPQAPRLFEGAFAPPIPGAAAASGFGRRRVFNGQPRAPHSGADLRAKTGAPVRAPAAGRAALAGTLFFSGKTVVLDHGLGLTTLYAHLSRILVQPGDPIRKGQLIGRVGATGRVTGPHLHWALKLGEARVDPYSLLALDLDARLKPRPEDPLARSPACARADLPPAPPWGRAAGGLRARVRPLKPAYAPGETVTLLVEIQNAGGRSAFLDFVRDPGARGAVLGFNRAPEPFSQLASSATARLVTEQVKIPPNKTLCFEQDRDAAGPLLAAATTSYALQYATDFLYSTSTVRAGVWRGRLAAPPAEVVVSSAAK
ncbi:MAG: M23 family metallopeptidase [Elusimicrobia bacterium]|nr:M23 family metallopeptidase [Elusimicrobiota bacterium]